MNLKTYLDSTYLKTASQAGISVEENNIIVKKIIQETIDEEFKLIMIRPEQVAVARKMIDSQNSKVTVGTVISFPEGVNSIEEKLQEAQQAITDRVDDLDFVCNYKAFKQGNIQLLKDEIRICTQLGLQHNKIVKWIIEVAALTNDEIIRLTTLIKNVVIANFKEDMYQQVFIKSSTGFFVTQNNKPNGATIETILLMLENGFPLPIKAAGGVKTYEDAIAMIKLGVKRIGTSSAKEIINKQIVVNNY